MPVLHVVNHPDALPSCLLVAGEEDTVLLIDEAVEAAFDEGSDRALVVLVADAKPAESQPPFPDTVIRTNYEGFVRLVTEHQPIVSWR